MRRLEQQLRQSLSFARALEVDRFERCTASSALFEDVVHSFAAGAHVRQASASSVSVDADDTALRRPTWVGWTRC